MQEKRCQVKAKPMRKSLMMSVLMAALAGYGDEPRANPGRDSAVRTNKAWQVQVGWVHQWGRGMTVKGPATAPLSGGRGLMSGAAGLTYPDNSALIPRTFDDGYVRPDLWTHDPGVPAERRGMTWNWGANNASQYDYDGGVHPTLTFHINRGEYVGSAYSLRSDSADDDVPSNGIEIKAKRLLRSWVKGGGVTNDPNAKVALDMNLVVGLAWFPSGKQKYRREMGQDSYSLTESYTYLDYFGTPEGGSWPALDVPYAGSYGTVGGSDAGPLIPGTPESSALASAYLGTAHSSVEVKSKLWRLRGEIGVEFAKPLTERLCVYVAPQLVLEFVDMSVDRTETGMGLAGSKSEHKHKMAVYPGVLLTAGADYRLSETWYAGASLGYEWLFDDPSVRVGSDRVEYDLNGGELSLYVGCRF